MFFIISKNEAYLGRNGYGIARNLVTYHEIVLR